MEKWRKSLLKGKKKSAAGWKIGAEKSLTEFGAIGLRAQSWLGAEE